ncbi:acyl-CoA dehydrogenase family protein [Streptomyces sp. 4F14]|uniref:acyl-CoA dehydrogenase family protein n=1 Tax=Streptomyces sp. 4F14 TaxID=3394380 RepID=UPI003A89D109
MAGTPHTLTQRPPSLAPYDVYGTDPVLVDAVGRHLAPEHRDEAHAALSELGRSAGSVQVREWAVQAEGNPPRLRTHDRYGNRVDEVDFAPAWHRLLGKGVGAGLTRGWSEPGGQVRRAAGFLVWSQVDAGACGPLSTTYAAVPALRTESGLAAEWEPALTSGLYERELGPVAGKGGALVGLAVAERAGSDDGALTTVARPLAEPGAYELTGLKWFCSAPMSDGFLVLARAAEGPTCFLVPRVLADGSRNRFPLRRLKDKPGNRSDASAEVEFAGTWARRVGAEGRGVRVLAATVEALRLDRVLGSAGLMRQAVVQAVHHCAHREVSGSALLDRPLMRGVLADLALESEAATVLALRLAAASDDGGERERALLRIAGPAAKYWVTKRCPPVVTEAAECLGGDGYVEESGLPRLVREAPLNALREGPGNVQALEVLRALQEPAALDAYLREVALARGADHRLDAAIKDLLTELADLAGAHARARRLAERFALVLQGALLVRFAPPEVADAFCASRLGGDAGMTFGGLPHTLDLGAVVERARVVPEG